MTTNAEMNAFIRGGRGQVQQEPSTPAIADHTVKSYADMLGMTLADARDWLAGQQAAPTPTPPAKGNAVSGTAAPPILKKDMNWLIRRLAGRVR